MPSSGLIIPLLFIMEGIARSGILVGKCVIFGVEGRADVSQAGDPGKFRQPLPSHSLSQLLSWVRDPTSVPPGERRGTQLQPRLTALQGAPRWRLRTRKESGTIYLSARSSLRKQPPKKRKGRTHPEPQSSIFMLQFWKQTFLAALHWSSRAWVSLGIQSFF